MNRLGKKCVIATAGIHLLLLVILVVGPAFLARKPKADDTQVLDVIPANLIDAAFNSGVKNATPPPPTPVVPQPQPPQPQQQTSLPPKTVEPIPAPSILDRVKSIFKPEPVKPAPPKTHTPKVDLHQVTRTAPKNSANPQNAKAINNAIKNLQKNLSKGTEINLSGNSSVAYASYGAAVVSAYHIAWTPPDGMSGDNVTVQFKVTIASDGTVISASITTPSGDANVDKAVQRMLDRVAFIAPFPDGTTDKERTYPINFNATKTAE